MQRPASRAFFPVAAVLLAGVLPYFVIEGAHTVLQGAQAETSLAYSFYANRIVGAGEAAEDRHDANTRSIASPATIESMIGLMRDNGVGLGNSPFSVLKTESTAINTMDGDCKVQKPNLQKTVGFLRTNLFDPFDQMTFFLDADRRIPAELQAFFDRYAFRTVRHRTNAFGERLTLPEVAATRVVLIAGDSVANGIMLDDEETLASRLQARDRDRRYVNLGIAGADASDIVCALERAASRYHGKVDELVYILCENDFEHGGPNSDPDEVVTWISAYLERENIARATLIYMPYIFNTAPEVTRVRGHSHFAWPTFREEKTRLLAAAAEHGIRVVDFLDLAETERQRVGSQFASLALYVDHSHWSTLGVERMAAALRAGSPRWPLGGRDVQPADRPR